MENVLNYIMPNAPKAKVALIVDIGSNDDGKYYGMAHLLEHTLIMCLNEREELDVSNYMIRAYTDFDRTVYTIECKNTETFINEAVDILRELFSGKYLNAYYLNGVKEDVIQEILESQKNKASEEYIIKNIIQTQGLEYHCPVGEYEQIKKITFKNLIDFFHRTYCRANFKIIIAGKAVTKYNTQIVDNHYILSMRKKVFDNHISYSNFPELMVCTIGDFIYLCKKEEYTKTDNIFMERIAMDVIKIIIPYILDKYMPIHDVEYYSIRYIRDVQYYCVRIKNSDLRINDVKSLLKCVEKYFNEEIFKIVKKEYKKELSKQKRNIENNMIYECISCVEDGMAILCYEEYLKNLSMLSFDDISYFFNKWIDICYSSVYNVI